MKNIFKRINGLIFRNFIWLFFDKVYGGLITLFVFSRLAEYFESSLFGIWNYLQAFAAIVPAIGSLGTNFILVKLLKERPQISSMLLLNGAAIRFSAGIATTCVVMVFFFILDINAEKPYSFVLFILCLAQVFLTTNIFIYKNESELRNKNTVIARNIALTIGTIIKLYGIETSKEITFFAGVFMGEYLLFLLLSYFFSKKEVLENQFSLNKKISFTLIKEGLPLMLSAVVVIIYLRIDQIFVGYFLNNEEVGIYASATRVTEMFYVIPVILSNVFFPKMVELKKGANYFQFLEKLFALTFWITLLTAVIISAFSKKIIILLFGTPYLESAEILFVYSFTLVLMGLLVTSSKHLLVKDRADIIFKRDLAGLVINIALNFALIPRIGLMGAVWSTIISYSVAAYLAGFFFSELRPIMKSQIVSIFTFPISLIREFNSKKVI